jgi:hypothetical protein
MFRDKSKDVPVEIKKAGMSEWYASLNDVNRVKLGRYITDANVSSKVNFCMDVMKRANADENYSVANIIGEYILEDTKGLVRFDVLEELILADFGVKKYEECLKHCDEGLDLISEYKNKIIERNNGELPERIVCRNYTINVLVGINSNYDAGDAALERFYELGLISEEDLNFRKQSHKIHKLQRVFDGIYAVKLKDQ